MKKLFAAAVLLAASAAVAGAQVADGETTHTIPSRPTPKTAWLEPSPAPTCEDVFAPGVRITSTRLHPAHLRRLLREAGYRTDAAVFAR